MRRLILTSLFMMLFLFIGCGGGGDAIRTTPLPMSPQPAWGADIFPVLHWIDDGGGTYHDYFIAAYASGSAAYHVEALPADDYSAVWTPQYNAIVHMTDGRWGVVTIRWDDPDDELILLLNDNASWDITGVWTEVDSTGLLGSELFIDTLCYQNLIIPGYYSDIQEESFYIFPDGDGTWENRPYDAGMLAVALDKHLSNSLIGYREKFYIATVDNTSQTTAIYTPANTENPKLLSDDQSKLWLYYMSEVDEEITVAIFPDIHVIMADQNVNLQPITETVYTVPTTADDESLVQYDAVSHWNDDTMHVVSMEWLETTATPDWEYNLIYHRRTKARGWENETIHTWNYDNADAKTAQDSRAFPQISIDPFGNIVIYYVQFIEDEDELVGAAYNIIAVNTVAKQFSVAGDQTANFSMGDIIRVAGSTGNDGDYTIAGVSYLPPPGDITSIVVSEAVPSGVADGTLQKVILGVDYGDLRGFHLDASDYYDWDTVGNWTGYADIDDSTEDILGCLTIGNHPSWW